jgi:hypothetical protein
MPVPQPTGITLDGLAIHLGHLAKDFGEHRKDFRRFMEKQEANEKVQSEAIGRCGRWGKDIEMVRNTEIPAMSARISNLESGDKLAASAERPADSAASTQSWGKMDWISFFSGLGALIAALAALVHGAAK